MLSKAIYPETFDPITNGHLNVAVRATKLFEQVWVAVAASEHKSPRFDLAQRVDLASQVFSPYPAIQVCSFSGLLANFARQNASHVIVRSVRTTMDFEHEAQLAAMNRALDAELETIFLMPAQQHRHISSSLVKDIAKMDGDVTSFVPQCVADALLTF